MNPPDTPDPQEATGLPVSRRAVIAGIAAGIALVALFGLLARHHTAGAIRATARIDTGLRLAERVLEVGRQGSSDLRSRATVVAEEITQGIKAGVLRESDLAAIARLVDEATAASADDEKRRFLDAIASRIMERVGDSGAVRPALDRIGPGAYDNPDAMR